MPKAVLEAQAGGRNWDASVPLPPPQAHCSFPGPASRMGGALRGRQPCFLSGLTFLVGQGTTGKGTEGLRGEVGPAESLFPLNRVVLLTDLGRTVTHFLPRSDCRSIVFPAASGAAGWGYPRVAPKSLCSLVIVVGRTVPIQKEDQPVSPPCSNIRTPDSSPSFWFLCCSSRYPNSMLSLWFKIIPILQRDKLRL